MQDQKQKFQMVALVAGFTCFIEEDNGLYFVSRVAQPTENDWIEWNPYLNDGDAHRLAIVLGLTVHYGLRHVSVEFNKKIYEETSFSDIYAAARKAIFRAAVEIADQKRAQVQIRTFQDALSALEQTTSLNEVKTLSEIVDNNFLADVPVVVFRDHEWEQWTNAIQAKIASLNPSPVHNCTAALVGQPAASAAKEIVILVNPDFVPKDGTVFDAVLSALEHFEIPAQVFERSESQMPQVVITLDGGIIEQVTSNVPLKYLVYDHDVEGCDKEDVAIRLGLKGGEVKVYASGSYLADVDSQKVDEIFQAVEAEGSLSTCSSCGAEVESVIGCPDGAEVCQQCFDAGKQ